MEFNSGFKGLIYIRCLFMVEEAFVKKKGKIQESFVVNWNERLVGSKTTHSISMSRIN